MIRYITEYRKHGALFSAEVDALDLEHAQMICDERGFGEQALGVLFAVVPADSFSHERASEMCRGFAESGDDEPPHADDFGREATMPNWEK
jgi:hypothetical protein